MIISVSGKTDRFNLSVVKENFINDSCFGEDISHWLTTVLDAVGVQASVICMENFGWENYARYQGAAYRMCISGTPDKDPARPNFGTWHVSLERKRSIFARLLGRNLIQIDDPVVEKIANLMRTAGFMQVAVES